MAVIKDSGVLTEMTDLLGCQSDSYKTIFRVAAHRKRDWGRFSLPLVTPLRSATPVASNRAAFYTSPPVDLCAIVGGANAQAPKNSYDKKRRQSTALTIVCGNLADYSDSNGRNA